MSKILTLAATGFAGVVLGAGIGVAAAGDPPPTTVERPGMMDTGSTGMGAMAERCDEMHAAMASHMTDGMPARHAQHHPDLED